MSQVLSTWTKDQAEEDLMNEDHAPLWKQMITLIPSEYWQEKTVLDFGCNQGGFLKEIYKNAAYKKALGVDLAQSSLEVARTRHQRLPTEFNTPEVLNNQRESFDIAFSHEVLYLLPDLEEHAQIIKQTLKKGGRYYAAIGCHTDQPLWSQWKSFVADYSNIPVFDYSLDDYANAFFKAGFKVGVQPFRLSGFFPLSQNNPYMPRVVDSIRYYNVDKVLFEYISPM